MKLIPKKLAVACLLAVSVIPVYAQPQPDSLPDKFFYTGEELEKMVLSAEDWKPYPALSGPESRRLIPQAVRDAYIKKAEQLIPVSWDPLPASVFLQYVENGNRSNYEELSFRRRENLANLVLAEAFEGQGRFLKAVIDGIWALCEESFWGVPAHLNLQKAGPGLPDITDPVVDLFAAETASEMAWIYYLLKPQLDQVNPLIARRIQEEVNRRILRPYLENERWAYLGFSWRANPDTVRRVNNWNPWINSNILPAALILGNDELRIPVIQKTMATLNNFILPYPSDGSSDEGPQYWDRAAAAFAEYLEWFESATAGKGGYADKAHLKKMGQYICATYIRNGYYINYGDTDAKLYLDPAMLYRFGKDTGNDTLMRFASFVAQQSDYGKGRLPGIFGVLNRVIPALFTVKDLLATSPKEPFLRDGWMPEIELMAARSRAGTAKGLYLAAKGGNNGVSHNHNDIGNIWVYADGNPVLIDAGPLTYTSATFSNKRYELWNNRSSYHNVPTINGMEQHDGAAFRAKEVHYFSNNRRAGLSLDIAPAYPPEAGIVSWQRTTTLNRKRNITIRENYALKEYREPFTENLLTSCTPELSAPGKILLTDTVTGSQYALAYDPKKLRVELDAVPVRDGSFGSAGNAATYQKGRMETIWGPLLYRIRLVSLRDALTGEFKLVVSSLK